MEQIKWEDPPPKQPRRADLVAAQLLARPGKWALIHTTPSGIEILPWYLPIYNNPDFEVRFVSVEPRTSVFGPKKVYARARVKDEDAT